MPAQTAPWVAASRMRRSAWARARKALGSTSPGSSDGGVENSSSSGERGSAAMAPASGSTLSSRGLEDWARQEDPQALQRTTRPSPMAESAAK